MQVSWLVGGFTTLVQTEISLSTGWIGTKFGTNIHSSQKTYPNDFGDLLTSSQVSPWGSLFIFQ